jgi:hypothetical protein
MEQDDLKTALQDFYTRLRDNYRCEAPAFVMHPRGYDRYARKIADGKMTPEFTAWFQTNVRRGDIMEP